MRRIAELIPWLRRLPGKYRVSGFVDPRASGLPEERIPVQGGGACVGFGLAPGVQCELDFRWPGGSGDGATAQANVSHLSPAMMLFGLETDSRGINTLLVDNRGIAEGNVGYVFEDTALFRAPCGDGAEGCQRVIRVTARQDDPFVDMQVDTEVDYVVSRRLRFQLERVGEARPGESRQAAP